MNLNYDCVRDLLLLIEEHLEYGTILSTDDLAFKDYDSHTITYTCDRLLEAGLIVGEVKFSMPPEVPTIHIYSLSWDGHQFLNNIRDDGVWKDTKIALSKFSSVSLNIVSSVATKIITNALNID